MLVSQFGVFESRGISAEPWKPTGELARVKFDKDCALILIPVTVDGQAHHFVLDTCCTTTMVDTELAKDLRQLSKRRFHTAGEEIQVSTHSAPRLAIEDFACDQLREVGVIDLTPFRAAVGKDFQGIIGMDLLRLMVLHIDFDHGLAIFCDGKSDPQLPGAQTPLILDDSLQPKILVRPRGVEAGVFQIDTGMNGTGSFDSRLAESLRRSGEITLTGITKKSLRGDGAVATVKLVRCAELEVAGHRHSNLVISHGKSNTLGLGFLRRHRATLDFINGKAYLEPAESFSLRDRNDYDGMVVDHEKMVVRQVVPGSAADQAGIKAADRFLAVGGARATSENWPTISDLLTTPRATPLVITVERDGQELAISIPGG